MKKFIVTLNSAPWNELVFEFSDSKQAGDFLANAVEHGHEISGRIRQIKEVINNEKDETVTKEQETCNF